MIDIAITNDKNEILYYEKWVPGMGFMRLDKEVYEGMKQ